MTGRLCVLAFGLALAPFSIAPAGAEVAREHGLIVSFGGKVTPHVLPRSGTAPVGVTVGGRIRTADRRLVPSLRRISIEINSNGVLDSRGLPTCRAAQIEPSSTGQALAACGGARVGRGRVSGQIVIKEQPPFPFKGSVVAFNARGDGGEPEILAHVYSRAPIAISFVLSFSVERISGTYGTRLVAVVPRQTRRVAHVTSLSLHLRRRYESGGRRRSYLSAGCPAPAGFPGATFPLVRARYSFDGGTSLSSVLVRSCHARS
ncbi:MAG: hypothetical protein ACOYD4_07610 [Solirubrobacterales bacterium]